MTPEDRLTKIENGIRDLITVSRTLLDSQKEVTAHIGELRNAQKHTDDRLNALIDIQSDTWRALKTLSDNVEKLIRFRGRNGQEE